MFDFLNNIWSSWRESSRRERASIIMLFVFILSGFILFEHWTASFRLTKIQKSADIIETLSGIPGISEEKISQAANDLADQLINVTGPENEDKHYMPFASRFWVGMIFWVGIGFLMFLSELRKSKREWSILLGATAMGVVFSIGSMFLPTVLWPWFHFLIYPILGMFLFVGLLMIFSTQRPASHSDKSLL